jgi:hypothetical protein
MGGDTRESRYSHQPALEPAHFGYEIQQFAMVIKDFRYEGQEQFSVGRQTNSRSVAREQLHAPFAFERVYDLAYRGLRITQDIARFSQASKFRRFQKRREFLNVRHDHLIIKSYS